MPICRSASLSSTRTWAIVSNFLDRLERMRPDVVLVDISGWKEPLEGLVASIRGGHRRSDDHRPEHLGGSARSILSSLRAGINEYLFPPLQEPLKKALEKRSAERSRRRDGRQRRRQELRLPFRERRMRRHHHRLSRGGGARAAEPEGSAGGSRPGCRHGRVHHQDQVGLLDSGRRQQPAPAGHSLLEGAGLQRNSGSGDHRRAAGAGLQAAAQGRPGAARACVRRGRTTIGRWWTWAAASADWPWPRWKRSTKPAW